MPAHLAKTDAALQRLDQAVARLEWLLPKCADPGQDVEAMAAVSPDAAAYATLDSASRQVEARLDLVVERLQSLLEP
jgi:uncharacterized protein with von Willebrand factor type A (vWA) domain